ncbi:hypothetical protein [Halorubellus salinus]
MTQAEPSVVSGRRPAGITAGALYSACRGTVHRRNQQVAESTGGRRGRWG